MTTVEARAPTRDTETPDTGREDRPARAERGETNVRDRVFVRLAEYAVGVDDATGGLDRTMLGVRLGRRPARVEVKHHGDEAVLFRVETAVSYPEPVREVARRVRERVRREVEAATGRSVTQIDVVVSALERESARDGVRNGSRRGRVEVA